jgi:hypothetical protein
MPHTKVVCLSCEVGLKIPAPASAGKRIRCWLWRFFQPRMPV